LISSEARLEEHISNFLWNYFFADNSAPRRGVRSGDEGDNLIFTITPPVIGWAPEDPAFHIEKIEKYVEESKGKSDNLRKVKSDKSDYSPKYQEENLSSHLPSLLQFSD
jgi:hypothetical protein